MFPNWHDIPKDVQLRILQKIPSGNRPINVSKNWHDFSKDVQLRIQEKIPSENHLIKITKKWHDLSKDVQLHILKKIPSENLRMMCASKELCSQVTSASLMVEKGTRDTSYHIYSCCTSDGKLEFLIGKDKSFKHVEIVEDVDAGAAHSLIGSCCGLVCFANTFNPEDLNLVVWNPYLGKSLTIPTSTTTSIERSGALGYGFGFDSASIDFKVVRIGFILFNNAQIWADIYSLYAANRKTVVGSFSRPVLKIMEQGVYLNGVIHWIVKVGPRCIEQEYDYTLLTYNLAKKEFEEMDIIPGFIAHKNMVLTTLMINGKEKLTIYHHDHICNVWVMECYEVMHSWRKLCTIDCGSDFGKVLNAWTDGKITMSLNTGRLFLFNPEDEQKKNISVNEQRQTMLDYVGPYVESLVFPVQQPDGQN